MRATLIAAACVLFSACASTPRGPLADSGVRNYGEVDARLSRGAQPTAQGVATLADLGVTTIINLRRRAESPRIARYEWIPLNGWLAPRELDVERILAIIDMREPGRVFVHCQRGADRTGTVVAIYRITHDCRSAEEAIREARAHGMAWWQFPMRRFIRRWARLKPAAQCLAAHAVY